MADPNCKGLLTTHGMQGPIKLPRCNGYILGNEPTGGKDPRCTRSRGGATNGGSTRNRGSVRRLARRCNEQWKRTKLRECKKSRRRKSCKGATRGVWNSGLCGIGERVELAERVNRANVIQHYPPHSSLFSICHSPSFTTIQPDSALSSLALGLFDPLPGLLFYHLEVAC